MTSTRSFYKKHITSMASPHNTTCMHWGGMQPGNTVRGTQEECASPCTVEIPSSDGNAVRQRCQGATITPEYFMMVHHPPHPLQPMETAVPVLDHRDMQAAEAIDINPLCLWSFSGRFLSKVTFRWGWEHSKPYNQFQSRYVKYFGPASWLRVD